MPFLPDVLTRSHYSASFLRQIACHQLTVISFRLASFISTIALAHVLASGVRYGPV
jgi:hypothetical protein